ncbi:protein lev-9-like isoform X2 [Pomacea canaliculata]|uniref:protein lev-9-like isoform X2 n=1 Tax=Pomacea canaliculata TaxID=400727 RepID=UPI000D727507|nr:protein lev-9-like isoform X2 [Pomacea canaliculata]
MTRIRPWNILLSAFLVSLCIDVDMAQVDDPVCPRHADVGNRKCARRCETNVDCKSRKKTCECDGVCGRSCVNENLRCLPVVVDIAHGKVSILPYNKFGAVARYTCDDGYTLIGLPLRVCQGDETWNGEEPRCELNHRLLETSHECHSPPIVYHAHHSGAEGQTSYQLGAKIIYQCDPGYTPKKDSVDRAWCVGGGIWVGPNMTCTSATPPAACEPPQPILNGFVEAVAAGVGAGSQIEYRCKGGFYLVGNEIRTCQKDGTWNGTEPTCDEVACGPPPHVEHADHDASLTQYRFAMGTTLTYTCKFGYYREGGQRATCSGKEGNWIGPHMTCKARDCGAPGEINNGWRDPGYRFTYPTRVTYHCNEGYEMRGKGYRECEANGEWSGVLPSCEPIHCLELRAPLHGTMIGSGTTYGSVIRFICNDGFKVVGSAERTCQADRTWSGQEAFCEGAASAEINCGVPGPIWNGYLDGHRTTVGAVYFYRCNIRTKFQGDSFSTQCLENGQWSYPPPQCLGQCQVPAIMNGTILNGREGAWADSGTTITPQCLNGLVLNDTTEVVCNNGSWNIIPRCVPAPCDSPPPLVENGHRVFFGVRHGDRARYFCIEGYKLSSASQQYLTCQYGDWVGPTPVCEENYCPNPGELKNGKVYKIGQVGKFIFHDFIYTIKHGDRLVYECDRNYRLKGPRGAACVNGEWSPKEPPQCVPSQHPLFHKLWKPYEEQQALVYRRRR